MVATKTLYVPNPLQPNVSNLALNHVQLMSRPVNLDANVAISSDVQRHTQQADNISMESLVGIVATAQDFTAPQTQDAGRPCVCVCVLELQKVQ